MESNLHISIAAEFSAYPAGRDDQDGDFNGERFRRVLLLPKLKEALEKHVKLVVSLEGMQSFGSSFLEEAFGGLVRKEGIAKKDLKKALEIDAGWVGNSRYRDAINRYIERA
jgi:hypothetical protein